MVNEYNLLFPETSYSGENSLEAFQAFLDEHPLKDQTGAGLVLRRTGEGLYPSAISYFAHALAKADPRFKYKEFMDRICWGLDLEVYKKDQAWAAEEDAKRPWYQRLFGRKPVRLWSQEFKEREIVAELDATWNLEARERIKAIKERVEPSPPAWKIEWSRQPDFVAIANAISQTSEQLKADVEVDSEFLSRLKTVAKAYIEFSGNEREQQVLTEQLLSLG